MHFEIIGEIEDVETLAVGGRIRDIMRIQKQYGRGRICNAEVHWYEAHGIGRKKVKIKRLLD